MGFLSLYDFHKKRKETRNSKSAPNSTSQYRSNCEKILEHHKELGFYGSDRNQNLSTQYSISFPPQKTILNEQKDRIYLKVSQNISQYKNINFLLEVEWTKSQQYTDGKSAGTIQYKNLKKQNLGCVKKEQKINGSFSQQIL